MEQKITGRTWVYGDNIDTDVIIPARYLSTADPAELAKHCMEDIDGSFVKEAKKGDIVVGGANFGCGSSREHAPLAFLGSGVSAIVAGSFARIFFRNSINVGLPILECPELVGTVKKGDVLSIDTTTGTIVNQTSGRTFQAQPFPPFLTELINDGGLVEYAKKQLAR
jgi:3-isopropylmalate dehydratase, small subunit